ncbi:MAG: hypothetical protein ACT4TC_21765 [Myxococcaceae bacterium]
MPPSKPPPEAPPTEPLYPSIEGFIEYAGQPDVDQLFGDLKEALSGVKGPKTEQAKKAQKAVERATELLEYLISVRTGLEQAKPKSKK